MSTVETAGLDDIESLVELESMLSFEDAGVHDRHADVPWPTREGAADFSRLLADANSVVLVVRYDGGISAMVVGYAAQSGPTRLPVTYGVLRSMFVRADARGNGMGQLLTEGFVSWASARGCAEVHVDGYFDNVAARRLYKRCGFTPQRVAHVMYL